MIEVSTTTLSTTLASTLPVSSSGAIAPVDVNVVSTPDNIDQLLRLIQISGTISEPPAANGNITFSTALGDFIFALPQLPNDVKQQLVQQLDVLFQSQKQITATIQPGAPPTQAVLLVPNASPTTQTTGTQPQPVQAQPITISPGINLPAVVLPKDIVLPGTPQELTPPSLPNTPASSTPAASSGNVPTTPSTPSTTTSPVNQLSPEIATQNLNPTAPSSPAPTLNPNAPATNPLLQPGKEVIVHIDAVAPPNTQLPAAPVQNQVQATVIGAGANGQLILKAGDATLYVRANVEAPVGTHLLVTLQEQKPIAPTVLPPVTEPGFASLQQMLDTLTQINPQLAQQFMNAQIPQPMAQFTAPLLFFLSAIKQGDMKGWIGNDVREILTKSGKVEILTKFLRDMGDVTVTERDPAVGEWKSYPIPLNNQGQIHTLTLHVHRDDQGGAKSDGKTNGKERAKHIRFLIDVRMSRFGPIQLDGLVRPKMLDMIVRSEKALPAGLPQDLRGTYLNSIEAMGYTGSLSFQTGKQHWLSPRKETSQSLTT